ADAADRLPFHDRRHVADGGSGGAGRGRRAAGRRAPPARPRRPACGRALGRRLHLRHAREPRGGGRADEGLLRPHLLRGAGAHRGPALRSAGLRRQRRQQRRTAGRAHLHRLAAAPGGRVAHRLHPGPDARGHPGAQGDRRPGPGPLRRTRGGARGGAGDGDLL
ncbi:MAG: Multimeric flavodoxin WrbA, partial [uncultured Acetobacteraceae bacterium]